MKLGKSRSHKEEPQRQGMNVHPCPPSATTFLVLWGYLCAPGNDQTPPLRQPHPNRSPVIGWCSHLGGHWPPIGWQGSPDSGPLEGAPEGPRKGPAPPAVLAPFLFSPQKSLEIFREGNNKKQKLFGQFLIWGGGNLRMLVQVAELTVPPFPSRLPHRATGKAQGKAGAVGWAL